MRFSKAWSKDQVSRCSGAEPPCGLLATGMVNFMCQLDWAMGCPDIWLNMIPSVPVRLLGGEVNI